ncbi:MAG TPA: cytochrome c biogenesis protein/redoxin [Pyrinomonadaceae bacterium]|nr:cytochrome c biogenesis protein/redoxin [Pyrinomonadaceae bacterium]
MEGSNITISIAFLAGILSFLSPCVLPLVPGYVSLMSGVSIDRLKEGGSASRARSAVIFNSLAFNAGLSVIFLALGATAGLVGATILNNVWVRIIGGVIIIAFGLQLIGLLKISALYKDTRFFSDDKPRGMAGSFTLGIAFAAGWTPCIGPILGGIIGLAATSGGWRNGLLLSAFYSAGLSIPFLLTGLGINQFLGFYGKFRRHLHKVEVVSGVILIVVGLLVASGFSTLLASSTLASILPNAESWLKVNPGAPVTTVAPENRASFPLAPTVELKTLEGKSFQLGELRGRVVLLNFWATWCIPCRSEIPELNNMHRDLETRGLSVVGVSTYDGADGVRNFWKDIKQDYQVVLGDQSVESQFAVSALPTTFILDREGRIRAKIIGERRRDSFEAAVKPLLEETATARITN